MSRYPQMRQSTAYDRSLLAGAPELTNAERQAGYNIDALEQGSFPVMAPPVPPKGSVPPPAPVDPFRDPVQPAYMPSPLSPTPPKEKWWKTKRGRVIIGLIIIVFIGILCGIAAGAATAKNRRNSTLLATPSGTSDAANGLPSSTSPTLSTPSPNLTSSPISAPLETRTTVTAPFGGPLLTTITTPRHLTTTRIGGGGAGSGASTTLPPGVALPTATAPSDGGDDNGNDDTPPICWVLPWLSDCN